MRIGFLLAVSLACGMSAASGVGDPPAPMTPAGPAALEASLPELSCRALSKIAGNSAADLERRFRFEFSCGRQAAALASLDEWNRIRTRAAGETVEPWIRLELHARATQREALENSSYGTAFRSVLAQKFAGYDDRSAVDSAWVLGLPPAAARANLDRELQQFANHAELSEAQLLGILYWHATWQSVRAFSPELDSAVALDDAKRFVIDRGVLIRTKQGATLSADIVRPRRLAGPQPTALRFTIYSDPAFNLKSAKEAAARGYVGMLASARGKGLSTDEIVPWETEVQDTWAVIDWISRQSWSDGQVGMYGNSYDAFAQWAAAKSGHPALKTIVPSGASSPGNGLPMQHNVFVNANYGWPLQVTDDRYMGNRALQDWQRWSSLSEKWFESGRPWRDIDAIDGTPNPILQRQLRHPSFDRYWQAMQPNGREFASIRIPVLSLTGYFDDAGSAAVNYATEHQRFAPHARHFLVIGPWSHRDNLSGSKSTNVKGYDIDPAGNIDTESLTFEWFDHVLRGGPVPALLADRINYQLMGTNTWAHSPSIARMATKTLRLHLSAETSGTRHVLSARKPARDAAVEQSVDLADRGTRNNLYPSSAWLDDPDEPTHVAYLSEPFAEPVCVCGLVTGALQATIDRRDFDFTWALYELTPEGRYFNLSYYLGRASYAADPTRRRLLVPGRKATLPFSMTPLSGKQMSAGSRLLLLLTVNKNANAQVNYGTGKDVSLESSADAGRPLKVRWHGGSYIDIPLREARTAAGVRRVPAPRPTTPARG
jgi:uncharacterized protein